MIKLRRTILSYLPDLVYIDNSAYWAKSVGALGRKTPDLIGCTRFLTLCWRTLAASRSLREDIGSK